MIVDGTVTHNTGGFLMTKGRKPVGRLIRSKDVGCSNDSALLGEYLL